MRFTNGRRGAHVAMAALALALISPVLASSEIASGQGSLQTPLAAPADASPPPPERGSPWLPPLEVALPPAALPLGSANEVPPAVVRTPGFPDRDPSDPSNVQRPPKPKYRKLDSQLSRLAEDTEQGMSLLPMAGLLPQPGSTTAIAVSIYFEPEATDVPEQLLALSGVLEANMAAVVVEA